MTSLVPSRPITLPWVTLRPTAGNSTVTGDLGLTGSALLRVDDDRTLVVDGNANLTGGTLQFFPLAQGFFDVLDVAGDAVVTCAFGGASSLSRFRVGGSWTSSARTCGIAGDLRAAARAFPPASVTWAKNGCPCLRPDHSLAS